MKIRKAIPSDITAIYNLIVELAIFEKGLHEVTMTKSQLLKDGFGENPLYYCFVAITNEKIVGISLYYFRFSTWKGKRLYLEDLMVSQSYQNKGIGSELFKKTIKEAKKTQCTGMMWQVLNWNQNAIDFYKKYNATFDDEWVNVSLNF